MKKFLIIFMLLILPIKAYTAIYTPITEETALNLVQTVWSTFYSEELKDWSNKLNVLLLDPNIDDAEELASHNLTSAQPFTYVISMAWPEKWGVNSDYSIPKQVIKDPNIPFYFTFNFIKCNTVNDYALEGVVIHVLEYIVRDKSDYLGSRLLPYTPHKYGFVEKAHSLIIMATIDHLGATIRLYELSKWMQNDMPPAGENAPWQATLEPEDIKKFYEQDINLLKFFFPELTLEQLVALGYLEPWVYDTYIYLQTH